MADVTLAIAYKEDKSIVDKCSHNFKLITGTITFDGGNYVVGGIAMDLSNYMPTEVHLVLFEARGGFVYEYDYTNKKVKVYYYDYNNTSDGIAIEYVAAAISTVVRFMAIGK